MQYGIGSLPAEEENSKKGKQPHYIEEAMEQHEKRVNKRIKNACNTLSIEWMMLSSFFFFLFVKER